MGGKDFLPMAAGDLCRPTHAEVHPTEDAGDDRTPRNGLRAPHALRPFRARIVLLVVAHGPHPRTTASMGNTAMCFTHRPDGTCRSPKPTSMPPQKTSYGAGLNDTARLTNPRTQSICCAPESGTCRARSSTGCSSTPAIASSRQNGSSPARWTTLRFMRASCAARPASQRGRGGAGAQSLVRCGQAESH